MIPQADDDTLKFWHSNFGPIVIVCYPKLGPFFKDDQWHPRAPAPDTSPMVPTTGYPPYPHPFLI